MVAPFRYYAEIKDAHGNNVVEPLQLLSPPNVERSVHNWGHGWGAHDSPYRMMRRDGRITMKCFATEGMIRALTPNFEEGAIYRPQYWDIHVKNQFGGEEPRSYNVFKRCFITSFNWMAVEADVVGEIVEAEMTWLYQDSEAVLNVPVEMREEEFIDRNEMWAEVAVGGPFYGNRPAENSIAPADWRQFGF